MSISGGSNRILLDLNVHKVLETVATAATAAAAAAVSQELWTSGGALFQRAQKPNIPCGESLTSTWSDAEKITRNGSLFEIQSRNARPAVSLGVLDMI